MIPFLKIATSVVPPPISTKQTPASNSSCANTASALESGSNIKPAIVKFALFTDLSIFLMASM